MVSRSSSGDTVLFRMPFRCWFILPLLGCSFLSVVVLCSCSSVPAILARYSVSSCSMSLSVVRCLLPFLSELMCVVP